MKKTVDIILDPVIMVLTNTNNVGLNMDNQEYKICTFGKHKNKDIREIDTAYLVWAVKNLDHNFNQFKQWAQDELNSRTGTSTSKTAPDKNFTEQEWYDRLKVHGAESIKAHMIKALMQAARQRLYKKRKPVSFRSVMLEVIMYHNPKSVDVHKKKNPHLMNTIEKIATERAKDKYQNKPAGIAL